MPVFVQWKWEEDSKTFLVIFHFLDDYSEKNIRLKQKRLSKKPGNRLYVISPYGDFNYPVMTWAPSHVETALISQVLCCANIINGFNEKIKRTLRPILEVTTVRREKKMIEVAKSSFLDKMLKDKYCVLELKPVKEGDDFEEVIFCSPLDIEYVNFIWDLLKTTLEYVKESKKMVKKKE